MIQTAKPDYVPAKAISDDVILRLHAAGLSAQKIARRLGCTNTAVHKKAAALGLTFHPLATPKGEYDLANVSDTKKAEAKRLAAEGYTAHEIASRTGLGTKTIQQVAFVELAQRAYQEHMSAEEEPASEAQAACGELETEELTHKPDELSPAAKAACEELLADEYEDVEDLHPTYPAVPPKPKKTFTVETLLDVLGDAPLDAAVICAECGEGFSRVSVNREYDAEENLTSIIILGR